VEYWNNYWSLNSNGDCFSLDGKSDLSRVMTTFWADYFLAKGNDAYVLDLACGNGFVGKVAISKGVNLYCIGVDQSTDLGVLSYENKRNKSFLRLLPNTPVDTLKFVDDEFDSIVSQFGFEYSPNSYNVIANTHRQLKPGGELRFLIHSKKSVVYERSVDELLVLDYLLNEYDVFSYIRNNKQLSIIRKTIADECNKFTIKYADVTEGLLANIYIFIDALLDNKVIDSKQIDTLETMYLQHKKRLEEQVKVSLDEKNVQVIIAHLNTLKFCNVKVELFEHNDIGVIGWLIEGSKGFA
jgi:SAM-dependent methyltransferase